MLLWLLKVLVNPCCGAKWLEARKHNAMIMWVELFPRVYFRASLWVLANCRSSQTAQVWVCSLWIFEILDKASVIAFTPCSGKSLRHQQNTNTTPPWHLIASTHLVKQELWLSSVEVVFLMQIAKCTFKAL